MRTITSRILIVTTAAAFLALLAGLGVLPRASAGSTSVNVSSTTAPDGTAKVNVVVNSVASPGLGAWTIDVQYDQNLLTVTDCTPDHNGLCNAHYRKNMVRVTGTSVNGLAGDVTLASISVACKDSGSFSLSPTISVLADATIGHPEAISAATGDGKVTCPAPATPTSTPRPTATPGGEKLPGDADCDRQVTAVDAALILQFSAGLIHTLPCPNDADVNHDGVINAVDAAIVLQIIVGLI